jgi:hypothetical protein
MQAHLCINHLVGPLVDDISAGIFTLVRNLKNGYHTIEQVIDEF